MQQLLRLGFDFLNSQGVRARVKAKARARVRARARTKARVRARARARAGVRTRARARVITRARARFGFEIGCYEERRGGTGLLHSAGSSWSSFCVSVVILFASSS